MARARIVRYRLYGVPSLVSTNTIETSGYQLNHRNRLLYPSADSDAQIDISIHHLHLSSSPVYEELMHTHFVLRPS